MSTKFECRWGDCSHPEFENVDRYKEHIKSHIESLQPMRVSEIPDYRRAGGFGPASSAPQTKFDYLFNTQDSFLKAASPTDARKPQRKAFSSLGLAAQATPPISPLIPSPSMSTKIHDIHSPAQSQLKPRWNSPSPMRGLASPAANDGALATPSDLAASPPVVAQSLSARSEDAPGDADITKASVIVRSETPDSDASAENPRKRKQSVMFTEPTTPANKKKKKNPKTPFPDPDLDSSDEERPSDDEVGSAKQVDEHPYSLFTQAPFSSWDDFETPLLDDEVGASILQKLDGTGGAFIEEVDEEGELASQFGDGSLRVEDVTTPSPKHA